MSKFKGIYCKHQKGSHTVSVIAGISADDQEFIQVITNNDSYIIDYGISLIKNNRKNFQIGSNLFSKKGIQLHIEEKGISVHGTLRYVNPVVLPYSIMGPFAFLPVECRHTIYSLYHRLIGSLTINGKRICFTGGRGYQEGDTGRSFPGNYMWVQCNDFSKKASIVAMVADVPFFGLHIKGCICVVYVQGVQYRFATYLGVRVVVCDKHRMVLKQGDLCLEIEINGKRGHRLLAPHKGKMTRMIREGVACGAWFRFRKGKRVLLEQYSNGVNVEFVGNK